MREEEGEKNSKSSKPDRITKHLFVVYSLSRRRLFWLLFLFFRFCYSSLLIPFNFVLFCFVLLCFFFLFIFCCEIIVITMLRSFLQRFRALQRENKTKIIQFGFYCQVRDVSRTINENERERKVYFSWM